MSKQFTPEERRTLAIKLGINEQYLYQCLTGRRDMGPAEARRIETESDGVLTRQMLCRKTWQRIWPELTPVQAAWTPATIKSIRKKLGVTQAMLAAGMGCSQSNVSYYEQDQTIPKEAAKRLIEYAKTLGHELTFNDIYGPELAPAPAVPAQAATETVAGDTP